MEHCFALEKNSKGKLACKATTNSCNGMDRKCPFFKTLTDLLFDREEALKRIATLPYWQQQAIAGKHYKGEMPWRKYAEEYAGAERDEAFGNECEDARVASYAKSCSYLPPM